MLRAGAQLLDFHCTFGTSFQLQADKATAHSEQPPAFCRICAGVTHHSQQKRAYLLDVMDLMQPRIGYLQGMCVEQAIDELLAAEFLHATRCRGLGAAVERALDDLQQLARCLEP